MISFQSATGKSLMKFNRGNNGEYLLTAGARYGLEMWAVNGAAKGAETKRAAGAATYDATGVAKE